MRKILIVIDMQNDFIDAALGTKEAVAIVEAVKEKIRSYPAEDVIATMDTHGENYMETQEGSCSYTFLPIHFRQQAVGKIHSCGKGEGENRKYSHVKFSFQPASDYFFLISSQYRLAACSILLSPYS